ncbi:thiolase family protein [Haloferula sp.]|uniref:thiolase family protein n=1 Tax=Haloferula sp. TaxID=2497595 RepID=UPI003C792CBE
MKENVYLAGAVRTPIGRFNGGLAEVSAAELGASVLRESLRRADVAPEMIDEVIFGNVVSAGQGQNLARQVTIRGGLAESVGATTINKVCGSGMKSVMFATQAILCGDAAVIVAGGTECMSQAPYLLPKARQGYGLGNGVLVDSLIRDGLWDIYDDCHMGSLTDACSADCGFTREQLDDYAVNSYQRAQAAQASGFFDKEMIAVEGGTKRKPVTVSADEEPQRFDEEKLRQLRPAFGPEGLTTAGNASSLNDGAAALTVISQVKLDELNVTPQGRVVAYCSTARKPGQFTLAPIDAVARVLEMAGLKVEDIDLFEINEAFSLVPLAAMKDLSIPLEKVNPYGGGVALGHPIGASGTRVLVTLLNGLADRGGRYGVASLCIGGGEAVAMVVERPN